MGLDPVTISWLSQNCQPIFGYPRLIRFSWSTCSKLLEENAIPVIWYELKYFKLIILGKKQKTEPQIVFLLENMDFRIYILYSSVNYNQ